jgi:hypothetical protein
MEILIGVVIFVIGLAAESWLARYTASPGPILDHAI